MNVRPMLSPRLAYELDLESAVLSSEKMTTHTNHVFAKNKHAQVPHFYFGIGKKKQSEHRP
jgi:hypothetical protein